MSTYKGETPAGAVNLHPGIVGFFEEFYATSDDQSAHEKYADSLTKEGTLIMGTKKATGRDEILSLRKGMWSGPVKSRKHHLHRIYPFSSNDVMLHGTVDYGLHNGVDVTADWAAHAQLVETEHGKMKMRFYQVYVDSSVVAQAAASK